MLEATQEQETMLVVLLQVIVKLEVIQDVNNIKRYSIKNIFLFWGKLLFSTNVKYNNNIITVRYILNEPNLNHNNF